MAAHAAHDTISYTVELHCLTDTPGGRARAPARAGGGARGRNERARRVTERRARSRAGAHRHTGFKAECVTSLHVTKTDSQYLEALNTRGSYRHKGSVGL
jgi:hypothetical protein